MQWSLPSVCHATVSIGISIASGAAPSHLSGFAKTHIQPNPLVSMNQTFFLSEMSRLEVSINAHGHDISFLKTLPNDHFLIIAFLIHFASYCVDTVEVYAECTDFSFMGEQAMLGEM